MIAGDDSHPVSRAGLAAALRAMPRPVAEQEARAIVGGSTILALLLHLAALATVFGAPEHVKLRAAGPEPVRVASVESPVERETSPEEREEAEEKPAKVVPSPEPQQPEPAKLLPPKSPPKAVQNPLPAQKKLARSGPRRALSRRSVPRQSLVREPPLSAPPVREISSNADGPPEAAPDPSPPDAFVQPARVDGPARAGDIGDAGDPGGSAGTTALAGAPGGSPAEEEGPESAELLGRYVRLVGSTVRRLHRYPRAAERAGQEGTVVVELIVDGGGRIVESRVAKTSGHASLDQAALDAVRSVGRLPAPPARLRWTRRSFRVPFVYRLNG